MSWVIESGGGAELADAADDQLVDDVGRDRVEAGGRLVEEQDLGIGRRRRGRGRRASACRPRARPGRGRATSGPRPTAPSVSTARWRGLRARHVAALQAEGDVLARPAGCRTARRPGTACRTWRGCGPASRWSAPDDLLAVDLDRPASASTMPRMHLIITDLPVPEPPMMTSERPAGDVEVEPFEDLLGPERLGQAADRDLGLGLGHRREEQLGDDVVGGEDQDRGGDHRLRGGGADALGAALAL